MSFVCSRNLVNSLLKNLGKVEPGLLSLSVEDIAGPGRIAIEGII